MNAGAEPPLGAPVDLLKQAFHSSSHNQHSTTQDHNQHSIPAQSTAAVYSPEISYSDAPSHNIEPVFAPITHDTTSNNIHHVTNEKALEHGSGSIPSSASDEKAALSRSHSRASANIPRNTMLRPDEVTDEKNGRTDPAATHHAIDEGTEYPSGIKLALIMLALCLVVFLVALDQTIIATAIPKITDDFNSINDVGWYGSSYLLTTAGLQLAFGKIYSIASIKWTFLLATFIFEIGSLICAAAPNSTALIIGRAVAGLGCAGIFSGALIILAHSVPLQKRPSYMGFVGAMWGVASVVGPLLGGVFTDHATWRWCFWIILPIGAITIGIIIAFFKSPKGVVKDRTLTTKQKLLKFDWLGTILFLPAIICLLLALQQGGSVWAWRDARIIVLFIMAGVLLISFIAVQIWKKENATIPPRIIKQRSIAFGSWFSLCFGASFLSLVFYLPIWFQAIKGESATRSGILNLPSILGVVIASILAGVLVTVLGYYVPFMILSSILASIGAGLLTTFVVDTGSAKFIGYQAIYGLGVGFGMQQTMIAAQTVLKLEDVPIGTSIMVFAQSLGGALLVSISQNLFTNRLVENIVALNLPGVTPQAVLGAGAINVKNIATEYTPQILLAYNDALMQPFVATTVMACLSIIGALGMQWVSVKGRKIEMAPA